MTGLGFQVVYEFHAMHQALSQARFRLHGNEDDRHRRRSREQSDLSPGCYSEQCKDGTKMGVGMPEYLLLFRKPPTDRSNLRRRPVVKSETSTALANGRSTLTVSMRVAGDRLLTARGDESRCRGKRSKLFKQHSLNDVYDYEKHVDLCQRTSRCRPPADRFHAPAAAVMASGRLDRHHANADRSIAHRLRRDCNHLCPLQFDIVDRAISAAQSMPGETVLDPFGGIGTVAYRAIQLGRRGMSIELNRKLFLGRCRVLQSGRDRCEFTDVVRAE
jgi:hypothetical protein